MSTTPTNTHLPPQWRQRVLALLNCRGWDRGEFGHQNMRLLAAWARAEGGNATWNPLNTTERYKSSTNYNSVGVQNYSKPIYGVIATTATLINGYYNGIVGAMQGGLKTAEQIVNDNRAQFQTWGTHPDVILAVLKDIP